MEPLLFSIENGVATLTLNRPNKYNAVIRDLALEMQSKIIECAENDDIRCLVITGEGKAFCSGQDLKEATDPDSGVDLRQIVNEHYNPLIKLIRKIEKPVIAAVNGVAAGAGANIALACDIVIAKESATFIQAFSNIGLIPDSGGTYMLPRLIGLQKATALMMLGEKVAAKEAEDMGMIYKAVPDDEFKETIDKIAHKLSNMPTKGLGLTKRALNRSFNNTLVTQLEVEEELQATAAQTHDYEEGVSAFLEKRKPKFKGK
jgi:2-(1,2-epoxy-1,2-dihydrophenyl)acetyl-CoA isomerase